MWLKEKQFIKLSDGYDWDDRLQFAERHQSHATSVFCPSPLEHTAVPTMDGVGEWAMTFIR